MKNVKKMFVLGLTLAMVAANSVCAFAATSQKSTVGYGYLRGTLTSAGRYTTTVDKNNDSAQLTIAGSIQNKAGATLVDKKTIFSSRGAKSLAGSWSGLPAATYAIYGTHGVQNGTTQNAAAVYTVTHVN